MELMTRIRTAGIGSDDPRVREIVAELPDGNGHNGGGLKMEQFTAVCEASGGLIARALQGDLAVPDFSRLEREARPARVGSYGATAPQQCYVT
jgi:glutaminase